MNECICVPKSWSHLFALRHGKRVAPLPQLDSEAQGGRRGSSWGGDSRAPPSPAALLIPPPPVLTPLGCVQRGRPGRGLTRALEGRLGQGPLRSFSASVRRRDPAGGAGRRGL